MLRVTRALTPSTTSHGRTLNRYNFLGVLQNALVYLSRTPPPPNLHPLLSAPIVHLSSPIYHPLLATDTIAVAGPSGSSRPGVALSLTLWRITGGACSAAPPGKRRPSSLSPFGKDSDVASAGQRSGARARRVAVGMDADADAGGAGRGERSQGLKWSGDGGQEGDGKNASKKLKWRGSAGSTDGGSSGSSGRGAGSTGVVDGSKTPRLSELHCVTLEGGSLVIPAPREGLDRAPPGTVPALLPLMFPGLRVVSPPVQVSALLESRPCRWVVPRLSDVRFCQSLC